MTEKLNKISSLLADNTAAIITSHQNRFYLTGFNSSAGIVIITPKRAVFLIDFRYFEKAKETVRAMEVVLLKNTFNDIKETLKRDNIQSILVETEDFTLARFEDFKKALPDYKFLKSNELSQTLTRLRQIKSPQEIELIRHAQSITDNAFSNILNFIKPGVTEREIALELEYFMGKSGSEGFAFDTIAVSGKNSSLPHGVPTDKPLEAGDFLTMDFGAKFGGYCSDMTRTVAIGTVTEEQQSVYDTVLKAQLSALEKIGPNKKCRDIDKIARDIINSAGFEGKFGHGLGHSLGIDVHENPACNTRDETLLLPGMIMTVEPGIYLENKFGVRIEDMVLVTENGAENLTKSPKELIIIG